MASDKKAIFLEGWFAGVAGTVPTFGGVSGLSNNANGTLTVSFPEATGAGALYYLIHIHISSMSSGDLDSRTYLASAVDDDGSATYSAVIGSTAQGDAKLTPGTLYYVAVRAVNADGEDAGSTNVSATVTDASGGSGGGGHRSIGIGI